MLRVSLLFSLTLALSCSGEATVTSGPDGGASNNTGAGIGFVGSDQDASSDAVSGSPTTDAAPVNTSEDPPPTGGSTDPCSPSCTGKHCGNDGCGGSCGNCANGLVCQSSLCVLDCGQGNCECDLPTQLSGFGAHVVHLSIPATSQEAQCDANNDGVVNDADLDVNKLLDTATNLGFDANAELATQLQELKLVLLVELAGYGGGDQGGFDTNLLIGLSGTHQPNPTCTDFPPNGGCNWVIDPDTYNPDTCSPWAALGNSKVVGGQLTAGPSSLVIPLALGELVLELHLVQARLQGTISGNFTLTNGRLCGAVPKTTLVTALDEACAEPSPPEVCASKDLIAALLQCEQCTISLRADGVPVQSMTVAPPP